MPLPKASSAQTYFENFVKSLKSLRGKDPTRTIHALVKKLDENEQEFLLHHWPLWARSEQLPPPGDWTAWLFMGGRGAATGRRGIHDIVVVERRKMSELNDNGRVNDLGSRGVPKVGGQQCESGAQSLTARIDKMTRRGVGEPVRLRDSIAQSLLHESEPGLQRAVESALANERGHSSNLRRRWSERTAALLRLPLPRARDQGRRQAAP